MNWLFRIPASIAFFNCLMLASSPLLAQEGPLENTQPTAVTPEEIITRFAAKEKLFKEARDHYTYRQNIKVQTRDGDTVTGEFQEVFDVLYDDKGHRIENVVFAPQSSLDQGGLSLDEGDIQDFRNRLPFVLTTEEVPEYNILYVGQQQEDQLHCYVFDVAPKAIVGKKTLLPGTHLGRRPRLPDCEDLRPGRPRKARHQKEGQGRKPLSEVHHMARAD